MAMAFFVSAKHTQLGNLFLILWPQKSCKGNDGSAGCEFLLTIFLRTQQRIWRRGTDCFPPSYYCRHAACPTGPVERIKVFTSVCNIAMPDVVALQASTPRKQLGMHARVWNFTALFFSPFLRSECRKNRVHVVDDESSRRMLRLTELHATFHWWGGRVRSRPSVYRRLWQPCLCFRPLFLTISDGCTSSLWVTAAL